MPTGVMHPLTQIIFWQPIASPHQEAFLEAVAENFAGEVILGVEQNLPPERSAQGWPSASHKKVRVLDISVPSNHAALAAQTSASTLHIFTGFFSHPHVWSGFRSLAGSQAHLAIMSEAPEQQPLTGWLKRLRGRVIARRWASRFAFVLAIGGMGCEFFKSIGFPQSRIVPFGYYLDVLPLAITETDLAQNSTFRFISGGQLIHRKGIDILIKACVLLPATGWHLDIYGDGPLRSSLEYRARRVVHDGQATFHGTVQNVALRKALAASDCAILPSRFDGWGALVNECMAAGTPVICTNRCGAAIFVDDARVGSIVAAGDSAALALAMQRAIEGGKPTVSTRQAIHALAQRRSAKLAGERFVAMLPQFM
jgi:glycosyltransferase involved in cell wall biosynthesis